ncbi:hypothetical protein TrVGV298_008964 [Trichoderma virens]|nr:hypothetical protein TrVGV298_008964 [Trichoderma virens]
MSSLLLPTLCRKSTSAPGTPSPTKSPIYQAASSPAPSHIRRPSTTCPWACRRTAMPPWALTCARSGQWEAPSRGEDPEPMELGLGAPRTGLYIREDVVITCNVMMASFIKKTIKKAHGTLMEALSVKAAMSDTQLGQAQMPYMQQTGHMQHKQRAQEQQLRPLRVENLRKPLPARPTSWQTPPTPPMASLSTEAFQYRDQELDVSNVNYGYPQESMAPRTMRTPPHAYVPELL